MILIMMEVLAKLCILIKTEGMFFEVTNFEV